MTAETFYPGATQSPATDQQTMILDATAGTFQIVDTQAAFGTSYVAGTFSTPSTSAITITIDCGTGSDGGIDVLPSPTPKTGDTYTFSAGTFTLVEAASNTVVVYTKH